MHETTRQERLSDAARAQQLRGRLRGEGRQNERVIVVNDRMRMQLMQVGLPYKRGELFPAMGGLLSRLALHDAANNVIRSHVLPWADCARCALLRSRAANSNPLRRLEPRRARLGPEIIRSLFP